MTRTSRFPEFELRPTGSNGLGSPRNVFSLVARIGDGSETTIAAGLFGGEATEWVGMTYGGVRVAVFESESVLAVRVGTAYGNGASSTPDWTSETWYESTDGGRTWAGRAGPAGGTPVVELSRGGVAGWTG